MRTDLAIGVLALVCGLTAGLDAQQKPDPSKSKTKVPLVTAVGCATRLPDGTWMLTNASKGVESDHLFTGVNELEDAKKIPGANNRYKLLGTAEFVSKEELLKTQQRSEFTSPETANATAQLQTGRRVAVKGALIGSGADMRINLVSVQQLGDACK